MSLRSPAITSSEALCVDFGTSSGTRVLNLKDLKCCPYAPRPSNPDFSKRPGQHRAKLNLKARVRERASTATSAAGSWSCPGRLRTMRWRPPVEIASCWIWELGETHSSTMQGIGPAGRWLVPRFRRHLVACHPKKILASFAIGFLGDLFCRGEGTSHFPLAASS